MRQRKMNGLKFLKRFQEGYVMYHEDDNIRINCTSDYVSFWLRRGFKVLEPRIQIQLLR